MILAHNIYSILHILCTLHAVISTVGNDCKISLPHTYTVLSLFLVDWSSAGIHCICLQGLVLVSVPAQFVEDDTVPKRQK